MIIKIIAQRIDNGWLLTLTGKEVDGTTFKHTRAIAKEKEILATMKQALEIDQTKLDEKMGRMSLQLSEKFSLPNEPADWSEIESAYIAGLIDGEGCIGIYRKKNRGNFIQISLVNTSKPLADWLCLKMGANAVLSLTDKRPRNKQSYSVTLDRLRAYAVLKRILPYLRVKDAQAKLAIAFKEWQDSRVNKSQAYSQDEAVLFETFYRTSRELNRKGRNR
jgi:hypothetical protein